MIYISYCAERLQEHKYIYIHGRPHPRHPGLLVGFAVIPETQAGDFEFSTGSVVDGTVVGWVFGVTVMMVAAKVIPPIIVVLPPSVSVAGGSIYV
jgi:hypothetical protein